MGFCDGLIKRSINTECCDRVVRGVERVGVICNREDVDFSAVTYGTNADGNTDKHRVANLPLLAGKTGYKIVQFGQQPFSGTNTAAEVGNFGSTFTEQVSFVILENNPDAADFVDGLANGEFVVVLENKAKGECEGKEGYSAFQVYGLQGGLTMSEGTSDKYSDDNLSGWSVSLQGVRNPLSAQFLDAGSYAANKAIFDSLMPGSTPAIRGEVHIDCNQIDNYAAGLTVTAPDGTTVSNEEVDDPTYYFMATNLAAGVYTLTYSADDGDGNNVSCSTKVGVYGYLIITLGYNSLDCA